MATVRLGNISARVALNNGTDSEGKVRIINLALGNLSEERYNAATTPEKLLTITGLLEPCLSKTIESLEEVITNTITE